ncbi:glutaredoxin family protein [Wenzhouxiangella sp. XN79A]|uniref:glutaredoxin family protein n=1 Tax=Wenzhouxiangella sp. XN79A TaxID=2724193 RepID=UPI00144AF336|nr:glutaredoxin family protein [Wenzhouxiangella sp. XN79A]NKI34254.1 glutaredoxin family protein [Wenzhouxiangella sp. XN79A]
MSLVFYTRENCGLCDKARALLDVGGLADRVRMVDIDADLDLIQRYGDQVPVILNEDTGEKITWPFTASQIRDLVEEDG